MKLMSKKLLSLGLSIALATAAISSFAANNAPALAASTATTVSAKSTVELKVDPDIAYVNLGVRISKSNVTDARNENAKIMKAVQAAIEKSGIAAKDIQTSNLSIYPNYDYSKSTPVVTGYQVSNSIYVTVRNLEKVGDVVNAALGAGANSIDGISFALENDENVYSQALTQATKKASSKAKIMAQAAGLTLGSIESVVENGAEVQMYRSSSTYMEVAEETAAAADIGGTIQAGQITISAGVTVTYYAS